MPDTSVESETIDERSVGLVETQRVALFGKRPLSLASEEETLGPVDVAFETYGRLSPNRDNAIFICHALTGDAHAAGVHSNSDRKPGWWEGFIGPGKALDTEKYFIICANVLGGCQGTTGPGSVNPASGNRFCLDFPFITVQDIVDVHAELVRHLGIEKLLSVVGGSLGGMQVLAWSVRHPEQVHSAIVLASAANLSAQGIAFNAVGRRAIFTDPGFEEGKYYDNEGPRFGLSLARMIAHITYLSEDSIELKFGRRLQDSERLAFDMLKETEFQIESYLHHQGKRFIQRFDANSYLYLTRAMDYFHLGGNDVPLAEALQNATARFLVASYTTDWLFPSSQSRALVSALLQAGKHVSYTDLESPYGHDAFLIELPQLEAIVQPFLEQAVQSYGKES
ncbi:MAG: homoserine O-acetyltransferase [Planctomycetaceae bacterium]